MRWSDEGAHLLAQVRVHALNGDLRPRAVPIPLRPLQPIADPGLMATYRAGLRSPHFGALSYGL